MHHKVKVRLKIPKQNVPMPETANSQCALGHIFGTNQTRCTPVITTVQINANINAFSFTSDFKVCFIKSLSLLNIFHFILHTALHIILQAPHSQRWGKNVTKENSLRIDASSRTDM